MPGKKQKRKTPAKNPAAVALGRLGGKARAKNRSAKELTAIGQYGAQIRWGTSTGKKKTGKKKGGAAESPEQLHKELALTKLKDKSKEA